jgi:hypothetical protein
MFFSKTPPAFTPLNNPSPSPPHRNNSSNHNLQPQSPFLTKLPPELRNTIYHYTFKSPTEDPSSTSTSAHALSLLLTCHKINHEATLLAFSTYTFPISHNTPSTYLSLRNKISHLSLPQISAITSISYTSGHAVGHLTNALLLLPNLSLFEIRIQRDLGTNQGTSWFHGLLRAVVQGQCYRWQTGEKWEVAWSAQTQSGNYSSVEEQEGMGRADMSLCVCGFGYVSWLAADLLQESGRRVHVNTVFYGEAEEEEKKLKVILTPGVESLCVVDGARGFGFDVDEEYWQDMRRRNAKMKGWW